MRSIRTKVWGGEPYVQHKVSLICESKCWVKSEDFHSSGFVSFIAESIYMHNTPDAAESNK